MPPHKHEQGSEMMIDHLIEVNNLRPEFKKHGLHENDIIFIKEQIAGIPEPEMCDQQSSVSVSICVCVCEHEVCHIKSE